MGKTWFVEHPDAAKGRKGSSVEARRGRAAAAYVSDGDMGSLVARSERYLAHRKAAQRYSDDALLARLRKVQGGAKLRATAFADEARGRGLEVGPEAPSLPGHVRNDGDKAALGASLGALAVGLGAGALTNQTISAPSAEGPTEGMGPLVDRMRREHGTQFVLDPSVGDHFNPSTNTVSVRPSSHRAVLAHEIGHATPPKGLSRLMSRGYGPSRTAAMLLAPALASAAIYHGYDTSLQSDKDAVRDTKRGQAAAAATGGLALPMLWEEARATKNATQEMRKLFGTRKALGGLARLLPAYGTYLAAGAAAPAIGVAMLRRKQRQIEKKMSKAEAAKKALEGLGAKKAA